MMTRLTFSLLVAIAATFSGMAAAQADGQCAADSITDVQLVFHRAWFEEADEQLQAHLSACPNDALAIAYLAVVDMLLYRDNSQRIDQAVRASSRVDDIDAMFALGVASFAHGNLEYAENQLRQYLDSRPTDPYAQHFLGFTLIDQGKNDDGIRVLEDLLEARPDYFPAKNHLAYGLLRVGSEESAVNMASQFVAADRSNPSAWDTQAHILQSAGRTEEAIASLARSVFLDSRFAYGYRHMGYILASSGDAAAARAAYEAAIEHAGQYGPDFVASVNELLAELAAE